MKKIFLFLLFFAGLIYFTPSTLAVGEICSTNASCCTPPQIIQDGGGCPSGTYWIGSSTGGSCQSSSLSCGTSFNCTTGRCTTASAAPACPSGSINIGGGRCADWLKIIRYPSASTIYKIFYNQVLGRLVYTSDAACSANQVPKWNGSAWVCANADDGDWMSSGNNIYRSSGNVGIGTNSPQATLDVNGTIRFQGVNCSTAGYALKTDINGNLVCQTTGDTDWAINGANMYSGNSGNVGIGTTSPSAKLDVSGSVRLRNVNNCSAIKSDASGNLSCGTAADTDWMISGDNAYKTVGKVGIGTSSPNSKLSIGGSGELFYGIYVAPGSKYGVYAESSGIGVHGSNGTSLPFGELGTVNYGVYGENKWFSTKIYGALASNRIGVVGEGIDAGVSGQGTQNGVRGTSVGGYAGVLGVATSGAVVGVEGQGGTYGIRGIGSSGTFGVYSSGNFFTKGFARISDQDYGSTPGGTWAKGSGDLYVKYQIESGSDINTNGGFYDMSGFSNSLSSYKQALCWDGNGASYIKDCYGAPADYAEWYRTAFDETLESGEVVMVTEEQGSYTDTRFSVRKADRSNASKFIGIVSTFPNQIIGEDALPDGLQNIEGPIFEYMERQYVAVSLNGRVPVKAVSSNGNIEAGDLLTVSDIPGKVMKLNTWESGPVVGKALESLEDQEGSIKIFIESGFYTSPNSEVVQNTKSEIDELKKEIDQLKSDIMELKK